MNKTIKIEGMMCEHCVKSVTKALKKIAEEVEVSLEDSKAVIKNTECSNDEIREIIDDLGFEVISIK